MKTLSLAALLAAAAFAAPAFAAETVKDKKTCARALEDAKQAVADGSVSEKARQEATDLITVSEHLCTQANFVYADKTLAVVRGMVAEE